MSLPTPGADLARAGLAQIARLADPERTRRLDALERLWKGRAYDGRPSFWDASVPLQERAPCVTSGVAETAGQRLAAMVFGARAFPSLSVGDGDVDVVLLDDERTALTALVQRLVRVGKLRTTMQQALVQGLMVGTVCLLVGLDRGRPRVEILPAKWCTPELDGCDVRALDYRYRYLGPDGQHYWYRRTIDAQRDVVYEPALARADGREPEWIEAASVEHGLGWCPVLWHRNGPDPSDNDPLDGTALFAGLEAEIEALDLALSQRHRNGRYNGEPQMIVVGVDGDAPMGDAGRTAQPLPPGSASWFGAVKDAAGRMWVGLSRSEQAIKKAPGKVWKLPAGGDAKLLESSGAGAQILSADIDGLRRTILEARGIVIAAPETVAANASAALLRAIYDPMVNVADGLREEYGELLERVVNALLRVIAASVRRGERVLVRGAATLLPVLDMYASIDVPLELSWGEYFEPTWADVTQAVAAATAASGGRAVLSQRSAVRLVAGVLGVEDVDAEVLALEAEEAGAAQAVAGVLGGSPRDAGA